jgi:hypothetical protein
VVQTIGLLSDINLFSNSVLIQWLGKSFSSSNKVQTLTLPTSFTYNPYAVGTNAGNGYAMGYARTLSTINGAWQPRDANDAYVSFICIGY